MYGFGSNCYGVCVPSPGTKVEIEKIIPDPASALNGFPAGLASDGGLSHNF